MGAGASLTMAANADEIWKKIDEIKASNPGNRCTKYLTKVRPFTRLATHTLILGFSATFSNSR